MDGDWVGLRDGCGYGLAADEFTFELGVLFLEEDAEGLGCVARFLDGWAM